MQRRVFIALILAGIWAAGAQAADRWKVETPYGNAVGAARLDDGDSLRIGPVWVRLDGIDAPEKGPSCVDLTDTKKDEHKDRCWLHAKEALEDVMLTGGTCRAFDGPKNRDSLGRWLVTCVTETGLDVGEEMVRMGMACAATHFTARYLQQELDAREAKRGFWSGKFSYLPSAHCIEGR